MEVNQGNLPLVVNASSQDLNDNNRFLPDDEIDFPPYSAMIGNFYSLSPQKKAYLHLIEILDSMGCPKKAFGVILNDWVKVHCVPSSHRGHVSTTADFQPGGPHQTRDSFLKEMCHRLGLTPPVAIPVPLEYDEDNLMTPDSMKKTIVYRFSFKEQLLTILNNPGYM